MSVKTQLDNWARNYVERVYKFDIAEGTHFDFEEERPSPFYCETCGPDPFRTTISWTDENGLFQSVGYYGTLGEMIQEILKEEENND